MIIEKDNPKILIVLLGSIGDVTRALPLAHAIKSHYPVSTVSWVVEPKSLAVLEGNRFIDRLLIFDRPKGLRAIPAVLRQIWNEEYDVCLDLQRHFKSGLFSFLSGAKIRIGFHPNNAKEFNWIFNNHEIPFRSEDESKLQHYLDFVRILDVPVPTTLDFGIVPKIPRTDILDIISHQSSPMIGVLLGSTWISKDWMPQGYQKTIQILSRKFDGKIALLGDRSKVELAKALEQAAPRGKIINFTGITTLSELIYVISRLDVCVGPDSGPGHIAAALKVPYITLFGPTSPSRVAPYGFENYSITSAVGCSPCGRKKCPGLNTLCMRLISPEVVADKVIKILDELKGYVKNNY